ncbi:MAG: response regulator [Methylophilaceae bacterium]|nr:response regulator [Methylophilaceae bacterium]
MIKPKLHILLIEDNDEDRADLRQMLLLGGNKRYHFSEAKLGAIGVKMLLDPAHEPYDCVLLDYDLPDMDAPEILYAMCNGNDMPLSPVVVITGVEVSEGQHLLGAGAQDFIGKSWTTPESLTRAIENAIERFKLLNEHLSSEHMVRVSEERYRALFNSIDAGYAVMELMLDQTGKVIDARYLQVNPAFAVQTGMQNVEGETLRGLLPEVEDHWLETFENVSLTGESVRMEHYTASLQRWFEVYAFRLGKPQLRQVAILFTDTTERRRIASSLVIAKIDAEASNQAKTDFLLQMSHELRSPLNVMLGFTQLMESGSSPLTPTQENNVKQVLHAGWYLLGLINEILDLSSIESGNMVLVIEEISLNEVLSQCEEMIKPQAHDKNIALSFPSIKQPCLVRADSVRIKQVMLNLLTNAIKYNRNPGRIDVGYTVTSDHVRVSVVDGGQGLNKAQIDQLFQPFNRLGKDSSAESGTGVGLVISKLLIERMGGKIGVESTVGIGSCFWFQLDVV